MAPTKTRGQRSAWGLDPGQEVLPGRIAHALLGGGERYEAYLVFNARLMMPTVLKVLRPALLEDARARRSMAREARILARLDHPGLARVFATDLDASRPFFEMEHLDGLPLSTLVRHHGALNSGQAASLGRQLAATLQYLHAERVLHLDVKPSNIIMGPVPRLIDFSVARRIERASLINGHVGTDAYMSPEQADPALWSTIGPKTDTWGLGATLYYSIARRRPHSKGRRDATGVERFPQLVESPAPLDPARHSTVLVELVMSMLARSPAARPAVTALYDPLDELVERAGVGEIHFR